MTNESLKVMGALSIDGGATRMAPDTDPAADPTLEQLETELLRSIDSLYAEYGHDVTRADVEESIKGLLAGYKQTTELTEVQDQ